MTEFEQLILTELSSVREDMGVLSKHVGEVRDVVRGWRGQLVKQAGLVAIALLTLLGHACGPAAAVQAAGSGGSHGASAGPPTLGGAP